MLQENNFKVEIYFNPAAADIADVCSATDEIFEDFSMPCLLRGENCRVYGDNGDPKDFGKLYAAVGKMSDEPFILNAIADGYFDRGDRRDTLMTSFFEKS